MLGRSATSRFGGLRVRRSSVALHSALFASGALCVGRYLPRLFSGANVTRFGATLSSLLLAPGCGYSLVTIGLSLSACHYRLVAIGLSPPACHHRLVAIRLSLSLVAIRLSLSPTPSCLLWPLLVLVHAFITMRGKRERDGAELSRARFRRVRWALPPGILLYHLFCLVHVTANC